MQQAIALKTRKIGTTFVGAVQDLQVTSESCEAYGKDIYQAYLEHKVLVFREQSSTPQDFAAFGKIFGTAEVHHVRAMRHPTEPSLVILSNQAETGRNDVMKYFGDGWHADSSYKATPANATMLLGTEIPHQGGDTLFADVQSAYEDLPESEKNQLRGMRLRHQYRWSPNLQDPWARWTFVGEAERRDTPEVIHPLVRRHPETGKETLHIAPRVIGSVIGIEGMPEGRSDALIDQLIEHVTSEKYVYRHKWSLRDIIVWDNRALLHSATTRDLPPNQVRRLLRITTGGTVVTAADARAGQTRVVPDPEFV